MRPHFSSSSTDSPDVLLYQSLVQLDLEAVLTDTAFSVVVEKSAGRVHES